MRVSCTHPADGWTAGGGMLTCAGCGVRRVEDYTALGPAVDPPDFGPAPHGPVVTALGVMHLRDHPQPADNRDEGGAGQSPPPPETTPSRRREEEHDDSSHAARTGLGTGVGTPCPGPAR
ncbi:DUF6255 family natural product biosynthesis protein [Streptomyces huiliensis]|uniref:DUF6255 family natural product biosynthesis protein n=1 Tax=Streptomyces huiliensis TaxID=2876027 RepID=UPI001CBCE746|nr:hypothetical protein [Streptomyces huiliensis]